MSLVAFELPLDPAPLPAPVTAFLRDAQRRIDRYFARRSTGTAAAFQPAGYVDVYRALATLRQQLGPRERLCEWGSGFGVVAGLAALLGFRAHGIELDPQLVAASRRLLAAHHLEVAIAAGSFVPAEYAAAESLSDDETRTDLSAPDVYGDLDLDLDDFAVVFAYPWPTEEELYCDLFARHADPAAVLVTWSAVEGVRGYRRRRRLHTEG